MNIREPEISRALAQMIQSLAFKDRQRFLEDAEKASSLEDLAKNIGKYEVVK